MLKKDYSFTLPESLIAQQPCEKRTASRLLYLNRETSTIKDQQFNDLLAKLNPGDLLVLNNTRVIPARLHGKKITGGAVEVLIERLLDEHHAIAFIKASKSPKTGAKIIFSPTVSATIIDKQDGLYQLQFNTENNLLDTLEQLGEIPLPPYMHRAPNDADRERYQTVFAERPGAVAAPTAGLHFDQAMLQQIKAKGVNCCYVTLHVGAGTFQPVRVDNLLEHKMHQEYISVPQDTCEQIKKNRQAGGRIIAIGTTVVRSLESAALNGELQPYDGLTDIFIYPGFEFKVVDALLTNFHLPESTLLMLVSAFASQQQIKDAYQHAITEKYRFFSYGDAMFIE